jgi:putative transposase
MGRQVQRHTAEQAVRKLSDIELMLAQGKKLELVLREMEISEQTYYRRGAKYGLMSTDEARRLKALEAENASLKKALADVVLQNQVLKELSSKKW